MTPPSEQVPTLELRNLSKRFGAVQALFNVNFNIFAGEVIGLVGDNGAGKSTLIKCVSGIHPSDSGEIWFEGKQAFIRNPKDAADLGIQTIYQDLALCDNLDVVANLYLGREIQPVAWMDEIRMEQRSLQILRSLSVSIPSVRTIIASLSGGQRQSVAIARAVMWNSKLVILDEPTAALGVAQTKQVLELIDRLRDQGLAVIVISHNLADIFEVVDRISVLRLGRNNGVFDVHATSQEAIVAAITGAEFGRVAETESNHGNLGGMTNEHENH
jgi:D-xylose transport system ATP-binding protein